MITLLFDENMGRNVVKALQPILQLDPEHQVDAVHLLDFVNAGEADDVWLQKLADMKPIVLTRDKGRKHPRLPKICEALGITHIICTPKMQKLSSFEMACVVVRMWPDIVLAAEGAPGLRYRLAPGPKLVRDT